MKDINFTHEIAPYFYNDFNELYDYEIKDGGRGSTKSTYFINKCLFSKNGILTNKDIAYVFLRKYGNKVRRTIFSETLKILARYGISKKYFKITVAPFQITYLPNNSSIYFSGVDNIDDLKGFTTESQEIWGSYFEEMTEIGKTLEEVEDIILSVNATFTRGTDKYSFMGSFNPPKRKIAPINQWLEKNKYTKGFKHSRTNIFMLPKEYIIKWKLIRIVKEALNLKAIDNDLFRHVYLAEEITPQSATYPNYNSDKFFVNLDQTNYLKINVGVDTGESTSANYFCATGILFGYDGIDVLDEFYHNNKQMGFLDSQTRVKKFFEFCKGVYLKYKRVINAYIESADVQFFNDLLLEQKKIDAGYVIIKLVNKQKRLAKSSDAIEERIELSIKLFGSNRIRISKQCPKLNEAFIISERDKNGNRLDDNTQLVDCLDGYEYSILDDLIVINDNIMLKGVKDGK